MELRKKASFSKRFIEILFRLRLVFLLLFIATLGGTYSYKNDFFTFLVGASEDISMQIQQIMVEPKVFLSWIPLWGGLVVVLIIRFFLSSLFSVLFSLFSLFLVLGSFFILDGSDNVVIPIYVSLLILSFLGSFFIPKATFKILLPFYLSASLVTAVATYFQLNFTVYLFFISLFFADSLTLAYSVGANLKSGSPKTGSLIQASLKQNLNVLVCPLLALLLVLYMLNEWTLDAILPYVLLCVFYWISYYFVLTPFFSFMPLERLRSKTRQLKSSKKN